jgi:hypothetical protein
VLQKNNQDQDPILTIASFIRQKKLKFRIVLIQDRDNDVVQHLCKALKLKRDSILTEGHHVAYIVMKDKFLSNLIEPYCVKKKVAVKFESLIYFITEIYAK